MLPIVRWHLVGLGAVVLGFTFLSTRSVGIEVETASLQLAPNGAAVIPLRAVFRTDSGWSTYIYTHRLAYEMPIEIRQVSDSTAEITSGLGAHAPPVILSPSERIKHKTHVRLRRPATS